MVEITINLVTTYLDYITSSNTTVIYSLFNPYQEYFENWNLETSLR